MESFLEQAQAGFLQLTRDPVAASRAILQWDYTELVGSLSPGAPSQTTKAVTLDFVLKCSTANFQFLGRLSPI